LQSCAVSCRCWRMLADMTSACSSMLKSERRRLPLPLRCGRPRRTDGPRPSADASFAQDHGRLLQELKALQAQHSTALELLGERNERVDELEQDLVEAKTIYRSQILMLCPKLA
jgi:hypothetical protein